MNNITSIDLNLLAVFSALLKENSVSKAAKHLGLSQPAVSAALGRLRHLLKDPLFVRAPHGLIPTKRAETLKPALEKTLRELEHALFTGTEFEPATSNQIFRVSIDDYISQTAALDVIAAISKTAPGIKIEFILAREESVARDLAAGAFDLAIRVKSEDVAGIYRQKFLHETFTSLVRDDHPDIKKELTLALYLKQKHILVSPYGGFTGTAEAVLEKTGGSRTVQMVLPHFSAAPMALLKTDMIATVPSRIAERYAEFLPLKKFKPPLALPPFNMYLLWHERNHHDQAHHWLREQFAAIV